MTELNTKAPATNEQMASAMNDIAEVRSKDTTLNLPRQQKRILLYLAQQSEPKTVIEMMQDLFISDPRGHISRLRRKGYTIAGDWHKTETGRYKRYYIRKEGNDGRR